MNTKTLRLVIVLAAISIAGVIVIQLFWVEKAFDLRNKQFEHNVNIALLNVASSICEINGNEVVIDPIEQLSSNYFIVNLNDKISPSILESVLRSELSKREISTDFEYGIFDCSSKEMVYGNYVNLNQRDENSEIVKSKLPTLNKDAYYFGVYFPNKSSDIAGQMGIWIFSSIVLLIVIVFFSYTLFVIFKQKKLSEIQTDFINNMTHEFKTPIATIVVSSEVLQNKGIVNQPERLTNYANIIQYEADRLQKQVDRVLQITTIDKNEIELRKENTDINMLIKTVCDNINPSLAAKGGQLTLEENQTPIFLSIDKLHFTNIIFNLLDNAVKYANETPLIRLSIKSDNECVTISISDNGLGIQPNKIKSIFNKFYRVSTGNVHNVKGFGLGLYYVKQIVEAHDGKVEVASELGKGSTFKLLFPIIG